MYAVVETGGKQYRVSDGERFRVEKLPQSVGEEVVLERILMVSDGEQVHLGSPVVVGASVKAEVVAQGRGRKLVVFKKRRRKGYKRKAGHRQDYTELAVKEISLG